MFSYKNIPLFKNSNLAKFIVLGVRYKNSVSDLLGE